MGNLAGKRSSKKSPKFPSFFLSTPSTKITVLVPFPKVHRTINIHQAGGQYGCALTKLFLRFYEVQYPAILTEQARSIKELLYEIKNTIFSLDTVSYPEQSRLRPAQLQGCIRPYMHGPIRFKKDINYHVIITTSVRKADVYMKGKIICPCFLA